MKSIPAWDEKTRSKYLHCKLDGHQLRLIKMNNGKVSAQTKGNKDITHQVRAYPWFSNFVRLVPTGTVLYGELWEPGSDRSAIKTALIQQRPTLMFTVFGISCAPISAPLDVCEVQVVSWGLTYATWESFGVLPPDRRIQIMSETEMASPDLEGFILLNGNLDFVGKWKPVRTIDCVIIEGKDSDDNSKYVGMVGSLRVGVNYGDQIIEIATAGGMTEEMRDWATDHRDQLPGKVVEISYQTVGSKGRLLHPRFKEMREDKSGDECTLQQDPRLFKYWSKGHE